MAYYLISYSAKQSKHHREKESYYRDIALKAKSIAPYVADLEPDLRNLLKTYVAGELFAHSNTTNTKKNQKQSISFYQN